MNILCVCTGWPFLYMAFRNMIHIHTAQACKRFIFEAYRYQAVLQKWTGAGGGSNKEQQEILKCVSFVCVYLFIKNDDGIHSFFLSCCRVMMARDLGIHTYIHRKHTEEMGIRARPRRRFCPSAVTTTTLCTLALTSAGPDYVDDDGDENLDSCGSMNRDAPSSSGVSSTSTATTVTTHQLIDRGQQIVEEIEPQVGGRLDVYTSTNSSSSSSDTGSGTNNTDGPHLPHQLLASYALLTTTSTTTARGERESQERRKETAGVYASPFAHSSNSNKIVAISDV